MCFTLDVLFLCTYPLHSLLTPKMGSTAQAAALSPPQDLSRFYSRTSQRRHPSEIKRFYKYFAIPGIQNLAGGLFGATANSLDIDIF